MTTTTGTVVGERPPRTRSAAPFSFARLLRLELRHNPMLLILPPIAALFWFDSYRTSLTQPPFWVLRTFWNMGQGHTIIDFGPFVAGMAAWIGSREGRRGTADLVTATAQPRWPAQLVTWAATAIWAVGAYLVVVGVMFAMYAHQGVQGTPPWWWVAVGATGVAAFSAAGYVLGVFVPSRFAAALAAFGGFFVLVLSSQTGFKHASGWALILPTNSNGNLQPDSGMLYPYVPDLLIARVIFLGGIAVAVLGLLGLPRSAAGPTLRRIAVVVTLAGIVATATAVGLAASSRLGPHGIVIPALHDAAHDRATPYTPVCASASGVKVCLNPYYRQDLASMTAALGPALREVAGLPAAPVRVTQAAATYDPKDGQFGQPMTIRGRPPVLQVPLGAYNLPGSFAHANTLFGEQMELLFLHAFVGAGTGVGTAAQQAVQSAMLQTLGVRFSAQPRVFASIGLPAFGLATAERTSPLPAPAARRFASLPAITRRAWLATNLGALRSGQLTMAQLP